MSDEVTPQNGFSLWVDCCMSDPHEILGCLQSSWSWEVGAGWLLAWSGPSSPCSPMVVAKNHYILAYSSHRLWRSPMFCVFVTIPLFIP